MYVASCHADEEEVSRLLGIEPTLAEQVTIRTAVGAPGDEILKAASSRAVEMLVLAIAGHSALGPPHISPVAEEIAARAIRPVVFVPDGSHERKSAYTRLVVPLDGSIRTTVALKPTMRLAQRLGAKLDLLYVVPDKPSRNERQALALPMYVDQSYYEWPSWRESAIEQYRYRTQCAPSIDIGITLCVGDPAEQILRFAREAKEDAIVLVRSSHLEYGHAPVLRAVLQEAPCPVIVVPAQSRASRLRPSNRPAASKPVPTEFDSALSRWAAEKRLWTACLAGGVHEGTHAAAGSRQDRQEW
jgi:nucleotide-binding universal stress UspA family protein